MANNGHPIPPPPVEPTPPAPPTVNSIYNVITRRIRLAETIFGDRVKLVLRQVDNDHWARLKKPYLLVVPRQNRAPRQLEVDRMSWVNPREVTFIAQFDGRGSEQEYLAANDIDTGERQLVNCLASWKPLPNYEPTVYAGMRIQGTREPDVKVAYTFLFQEVWVITEPPSFEGEFDFLGEAEIGNMSVHVNDSCCHMPCEIVPPWPVFSSEVCVTGGGCR